MKKELISTLLVASSLLTMTSSIYADSENHIVVNGKLINSDIQMINNRILVPLRTVSENLGATVGWDQASQTATILSNGRNIALKAGDNTAKIGGISVSLDTPIIINDGRVFVPLRFVSDALGVNVKWDVNSNTAYINGGVTTNNSTSQQNNITTEKRISDSNIFNYNVNSADGVTLTWFAHNLSGKTIKYYTVNISTFNSVGDPSYDEMNGKSQFSLKYVGPVKPGALMGVYQLFTYQGALNTIKIDNIIVEYSDGTTETVQYGQQTSDASGKAK